MEDRDLIRRQYAFAHQFLEMAVDDVSPELATRSIEGATLHPIAHIYAHVLVAEDAFISGAWGKQPVLVSGGWSARTGVPEPSPVQTPEWGALELEVPALREYANAVYDNTDRFLAEAPEEAVFKDVDGPSGKVLVVPEMMLTHVAQHWGEIAALKGVHGEKGLAF